MAAAGVALSARKIGPVSHVIGEVGEGAKQLLPQSGIDRPFVERQAHAHQPLVAFRAADGERKVARPQARMAMALHEQGRAAEP